jgi:Ser/Thr protein kinase RdoA (MazF antagonist)
MGGKQEMMKLKNMVRGLVDNAPAGQLLSLWTHDDGSLEYWRASCNFVYTFLRDGKKHFLRFVHEEDNNLIHIEAELDFVQYLIDHGYPAAALVRSDNNRRIETIKIESGTYFGVVFEQAAGVHIPLSEMTDLHLEQWGKSLAALHTLSEFYVSGEATRPNWSESLDFIATELRRDFQDKTLLWELDRLREQLAALPSGAGYTGLIHYDFETDNVFYDEANMRYSAIDFDDCMNHWFVMDVASAVSDLLEEDGEEAARWFERFIAGYRSVKRIDVQWKDQLPHFRKFADFYIFARLKRSIEGFDAVSAPEWAIRLQEKLIQACDRITERYRPDISLRRIDQHNWYACTQLEVSNEQKSIFPIPTVYWLAESAYCGFTPVAVYAGEHLVGIAIYAVDPDDNSYWIIAYMIDRSFQHRGFGRAGMEELIRHMTEKHGCDRIVLGHRPENETASRFYASLGFREINSNTNEVLRELGLQR